MSFLELTVIGIVFLLGLSILWSTLTTGISPMMSSRKARLAMLDALDSAIDLPVKKPIVDLGSGWGTLVIATAKKYPQQQVIGYELSWLPWLFSVLWKYCLGLKNLTLYRKDFNQTDLNNASVLYCYLFSSAMQSLEVKLTRERHHSVFVISNTFALPSFQPSHTIALSDFHRSNIYVYHWQPATINTDSVDR